MQPGSFGTKVYGYLSSEYARYEQAHQLGLHRVSASCSVSEEADYDIIKMKICTDRVLDAPAVDHLGYI